jgi:hypothetical protein
VAGRPRGGGAGGGGGLMLCAPNRGHSRAAHSPQGLRRRGRGCVDSDAAWAQTARQAARQAEADRMARMEVRPARQGVTEVEESSGGGVGGGSPISYVSHTPGRVTGQGVCGDIRLRADHARVRACCSP